VCLTPNLVGGLQCDDERVMGVDVLGGNDVRGVRVS
jgi:hypothetical protein